MACLATPWVVWRGVSPSWTSSSAPTCPGYCSGCKAVAEVSLLASTQNASTRPSIARACDRALLRLQVTPGTHTDAKTEHCRCRVVAQCTKPGSGLPPDKPRYVMGEFRCAAAAVLPQVCPHAALLCAGIGYPLDIVLCTALGADMFDSVYPTRTARFGVALVDAGQLKLRNKVYKADFR